MAEGLEDRADVASAVAAAAAPADPPFKRRIQFHLERKPYSPISRSENGYFRLETLNPSRSAAGSADVAPTPASAVPSGRRSDGGLDPVFRFKITFRRIGAGLQNLGNTCYLNSVLQCLTYTEPFAAYCHSGEHKSSCRNAGFCAMCALQNHVTNALQSSGKILSPFHIVKNLRCISRNFRNSRQEDAHEYMVNLLESMHKCCLPSGVPTESPSAYEKSLVHKIFGGHLSSQVKCTQCNYCSNKFDPFLDLSLEILKADSLRKALSHFTAIEPLDGGERQYQCQRCKEKVRAYKRLTIHKAPFVLTIHLKRFGPCISGQKIDKKVEFEPTLNLKPFVSNQQEADLKYTLYGVLVHAGYSTHSGHYYCFVRTSGGVWHSLDDNQVRPVSEKTVLAQKAYMLFYVRDRCSAIKRSADGVHKDNILANAPGRQVVRQPTLNGAIQHSEQKSSIPESRPVKSEADGTSDGQPVSVEGNSSGNLLLKDASSMQKNGNAVPKEPAFLQNNVCDATLTEATCLKANDEAFSNGSQQTALTNGYRKSENPLIKTPIVTASSHNSRHLSHGISKMDGIPCKIDVVGTAINKEPKTISSEMACVNGYIGKEHFKAKSVDQKITVPESNKCTLNQQCQKDGEGLVEVEDSGLLINSAKMLNAVNVCIKPKPVAVVEGKTIGACSWTVLKRKKLGKSLKKNQYFGRKQLFLTSVLLQKNKKHKRSRKHHLHSKKAIKGKVLEDLCTDDRGLSTSQSVKVVDVASLHSSLKHLRSKSKEENTIERAKDIKYVKGGFVQDRNLDKSKNDAMLATSDQPRRPLNFTENQCDGREADACGKESVKKCVIDLLRGLKDTPVPRWDDVELSSYQPQDLDDAQNKTIGYVLDEWDEEYDRGKRKKFKKSKSLFGETSNPFQEVANVQMQQRDMKTKVSRTSSGNQPLRI